ncbi:hypothetical protein C8F04DRAFT_645408 [Mycena alexandri]|uniref:BRCT domain-containing protein n=1 Tax=Mycena alexandri TaxID=1745969 RepID=A0AAD6WZ05_9AGAR|nr:hypothetical protein C8F04DRAFT_645408 [Mycena alexandri]
MGLTKDVTHLFAVSPISEKYSTGMSHRDQTGLKVLVPDWFDDSVQLGVRDLSTETYEWPEPEVLTRRPQTPTRLKEKQRSSLSPQKKALYTTASWDPSKPLLVTQDVWGGRRILLSTSLELSGSRRCIVEDGIRKAKGVPVAYSGEGTVEEEVDLLKDCDVLVTRYRTGQVFFEAWRAGKAIGTLSWLLNAQVTGVYSSPLDQLLHFPIPPGAVAGFEEQIISVTNYAGEMRDYLKKLITLMGGNFTPNLSTKNTALIAASLSGSKTDKAAEWSIPIVNHTWLEDCFLRWQKLTPATPKYVSYPPGRDFSDLLGERGVGPLIAEIIEGEARRLGLQENADMSDGEEKEEDREVDNANANYPPHHHSQASADDETEVEGGLLPAMDLDLDPDVDVNMDFGGGDKYGDDGADPFDIDEPMLFEEEPEPPRHTTPPKKSPPKSKSQSKSVPPATPKSAVKPKRRTRGLSSSEPEIDEEIRNKVIRVPRTLASPAKSVTRRKKEIQKKEEKSRDTASDSGAEEKPLKLPARFRRVSGPAVRSSPRKVPDSTKKPTAAGDSDADEASDAEAQTPAVRRSPRKAPVSTRKLPGSTRIVPDSTSKGSAAANSDEEKDSGEEDSDEDGDIDAPAALRRSPRKVLDSRSGVATTSTLRPLDSDSDDLDDLPIELAPPPRTAKPATVGRVARSTGMAPKKSSTAGKKKELPPRKAAATPTPPSSPLSAPPSRSVKRVPTTPFAVVVPHVRTSTSFSASAKKLLPLEREHSITAVSHHRAAPASASAPPRSRPRASSSGSTAVASSVGPALPVVVENGGRAKRSAAKAATKKLHDEIMPDLVNYENERRNRGRKSQSRRVSGRAETDDGDEGEEEEGPRAKRRKLDGGKGGRTSTSEDETALEQPAKAKPRKSDVAQRNGKAIKLITTGLKNETLLSEDVYKTLSRLGVKSTTRATECTHLVVPHLVRTENFLCALTSAPFILRREWAVDSAAAETLLPEEDYLLQDDDGERKYNFSLAEAVSRAKNLKGRLFKGHTFYITKGVKAMNIVRNVVIANGGQAITNWQPSLRTLETDTNRHVISCADDVALWKQIAITHAVYNYELVLTSALRQEIDWEDAAFRLEA